MATQDRPYSRSEVVLFSALAVLVVLVLAALYLLSRHSGTRSAWEGLPLDDTWIHLVYARSLATQGWFYYNPGVAEAGMSSPFWVVLLAVAYKFLTPLGVSPAWCAKSLSLLIALTVPTLTYLLACEVGLSKRWAWFAGLLVAVEPNLAYGNVAGMEVPLFTALTLAAIRLSLKRRYVATGLLLGLSVITRGEGALNGILIGAGALLPIYLKRQEVTLVTEEELRTGLKLFLPPAVLGSLWALYNYTTSGHFLPNTYYVKHDFALGYFNLENLFNVLRGYLAHLAFFRGPLSLVMVALVGLAAWRLWHEGPRDAMISLLGIPLAQVYAFSINLRVVAVETPWTYFTRRYLDFLIPLWILLGTLGLAFLWSRLSRKQERWVALTTPLIAVLVALLVARNMLTLHAYFVEQYSWNTRNVAEVNQAMGQWLAENLPPNTTIGVTDAGALRFFTRPDQTVIDFLGLNCAPCIGLPIDELIEKYQPDYIVVFRQALTDTLPYEEVYSVRTERNTILGGSELVAARRVGTASR